MKTADIKADSNGNTDGKGACLMVLLPDGTRIQSDRMLTEPTDSEVDGGWERISLTFTLAEQKTVTVFAGILGMTGTMYISGCLCKLCALCSNIALICGNRTFLIL